MSDHKPDGPYVYQPFGVKEREHWDAGRVYAVGGMSRLATLTGLTKDEATKCAAAIRAIPDDVARARDAFYEAARARMDLRSEIDAQLTDAPFSTFQRTRLIEADEAEDDAYDALLAAEARENGVVKCERCLKPESDEIHGPVSKCGDCGQSHGREAKSHHSFRAGKS